MVELKYTPEEAARKAEELIAQRQQEKRAKKRDRFRAYREGDPERYRDYYRDYERKNRPKRLAQQRDRRSRLKGTPAYKASVKAANLKRKFGLTLEERDALLAAQGGVCGGCRRHKPRSKKDWCVDHCHETGMVRGILCNECNTSLGMMDEDPEAIERLAQYAREKCVGSKRREERSQFTPDAFADQKT